MYNPRSFIVNLADIESALDEPPIHIVQPRIAPMVFPQAGDGRCALPAFAHAACESPKEGQ